MGIDDPFVNQASDCIFQEQKSSTNLTWVELIIAVGTATTWNSTVA